MPGRQPLPHRLATTARWPVGIALTSWSYIWRTTVLHRRELDGTWAQDGPPEVPPGVSREDFQHVEDGVGPLLHRRYVSRIRDADRDAEALIACVSGDPNVVAPGTMAHFHKSRGEDGRMAVGDEYLIRIAGPWDGPVRCVEKTPRSFRFVTLEGHLEAGQIEWAAADLDDGMLEFRIESWARLGDRISAIMHDKLRMAKEVQLHMWTTVHEEVAKLVDGRITGGIDIETRRVEV